MPAVAQIAGRVTMLQRSPTFVVSIPRVNRIRRILPIRVAGAFAHFAPRYAPWDRRIHAVPDGDFFEATRADTVEVVTDEVSQVVPQGVELSSGRTLACDTIVTATFPATCVA